MDVRRIEEEVDPDFLSDAHSRIGPVESSDSCESKISWIPIELVFYVLRSTFRFASFVKSKGALDFCSLIIFMSESLRFSRFLMFLLKFHWCWRFVGKRTNVNARSRRSTKVDESKLCDIPVLCEFLKVFSKDLIGARVAFEDEFGAAEEREVSCEAQQGRSRVKRKLFGSCRNNMGNEPILALLEGSDNFVVMRGARVRMLA
ncbi:hypothetical protein Tco_0162736 [Tanacetum coccineum]